MKSVAALLCLLSLVIAEQAPVFLWGVNSEAKPALTTVSKTEFSEIVASQKKDNTLVVFLENGLTTKDFSCTNALTSKSCYAHLQEVPEKTFYASVEDPVDALKSIGDYEYNSVDATGKLSNNLELNEGKVVFVTFDDQSESNRAACLESHDSIITSISKQLNGKAIFVYTTAPQTSSLALKRERRAAADSNGVVFRSGAELLLYYTTLTVENSKDKSTTTLTPTSMLVTPTNATALSVTLTTTPQLTFDVTLSGGYFFMTNVKWNDISFRSNDVYAPTDFSYFCGNLTLYGKGTAEEPSTYTLHWNSLQFQAPFGSTTNKDFVFGDAWHCVGFFTGGILSGLLIVALLLTITFVGVCWMMDINTMDRFDDPKGKTITINASE
ncbi:V-type proton ATPase subunit S1 [Musca vetustissima]|uniref:V-type proton ATPase subunit S1 n=1 Tax=Musca vetustissima TaxID=27455 RepID=UPI002AB5F9D0|nr:V-type proton ATPase subunit S1 [Musca vetustissima]